MWLPLVGAATAVALWWLVTAVFDIRPFFLPAPPDVVTSFLKNPEYMLRESWVTTYESLLGFAFPKDEREALVEAEPDKFMFPKPGDMRFHWAVI